MTSTFGVSGSGAAPTSPRERPERRRRGFGRLGMGTSRLVGHHRGSLLARFYLRRPLSSRAHSWTHQEGWRDWPYETPPTIRLRKRWQFLRDVDRVIPRDLCHTRTGGGGRFIWQQKR